MIIILIVVFFAAAWLALIISSFISDANMIQLIFAILSGLTASVITGLITVIKKLNYISDMLSKSNNSDKKE